MNIPLQGSTPIIILHYVGEDFWRWQTLNPDGYKSAIISKSIPCSVNAERNGAQNGIKT